MTYAPEPIDTSQQRLPEELNELMEELAANNHDVWARQRIADGWKHGERRDDQAKTHPGLVRYEDLAESEKEYDRATVRETLKAILTRGYRIVPTD